ncbi:unnamed protein product, partial [Discosporangium mesarthrocarpum]
MTRSFLGEVFTDMGKEAVRPPPANPRSERGFTKYDRNQPMSEEKRLSLLEQTREMFVHAYDDYMEHAFPRGELLPLSCRGGDLGLVKLPLVTLVDALDTLAVMGNASEFRRTARLVTEGLDVSLDQNVSLFETNIRLLGGLLSAHMLASDKDLGLYDHQVVAGVEPDKEDGGGAGGGTYRGELLSLALELGNRLLPAFRTRTGIPFGTVNLKSGVPPGETSIASLAGAGSLTLEFTALSALTGDRRFAEAAEGAVKELYRRRSDLGLLGKHIDIEKGRWTELESGVGPNGDSFYEYLLKMYILWGDVEYWDMFMETYFSVQRFLRDGDWYSDVDMASGRPTRRVFDSLMAFWPGMQTLIGVHPTECVVHVQCDIESATRSLNAFYLVWKEWGFLPEQFGFSTWELDKRGGHAYPLRPELVESTMLVYQASKHPSWLWAGQDFLSTINNGLRAGARTEAGDGARDEGGCGFAGVRDVRDWSLEDQMPTFFLSETLKYLYLLFDEDNFLHKKEYVFTTEAHPLLISAIRAGHTAAAGHTSAMGQGPEAGAKAESGGGARGGVRVGTGEGEEN